APGAQAACAHRAVPGRGTSGGHEPVAGRGDAPPARALTSRLRRGSVRPEAPVDSPLSAAAPAADAPSAPVSRGEFAPTIWGLAWPVIATFSLESLVGLIDMLMVGRL